MRSRPPVFSALNRAFLAVWVLAILVLVPAAAFVALVVIPFLLVHPELRTPVLMTELALVLAVGFAMFSTLPWLPEVAQTD